MSAKEVCLDKEGYEFIGGQLENLDVFMFENEDSNMLLGIFKRGSYRKKEIEGFVLFVEKMVRTPQACVKDVPIINKITSTSVETPLKIGSSGKHIIIFSKYVDANVDMNARLFKITFAKTDETVSVEFVLLELITEVLKPLAY
jgi:hypothetical protein